MEDHYSKYSPHWIYHSLLYGPLMQQLYLQNHDNTIIIYLIVFCDWISLLKPQSTVKKQPMKVKLLVGSLPCFKNFFQVVQFPSLYENQLLNHNLIWWIKSYSVEEPSLNLLSFNTFTVIISAQTTPNRVLLITNNMFVLKLNYSMRKHICCNKNILQTPKEVKTFKLC